MNQAKKSSLRPFVLWTVADVFALANLILRLIRGHIIPDILYFPAAVVILFTTIAILYLRRYLKEQKAVAKTVVTTDDPDGEQA